MLRRFGAWMAVPPTKCEFACGVALLITVFAVEIIILPAVHP